MHNRFFAALFVVAGISGGEVHAQTCAALQDIKQIRVVSANCTQHSPTSATCKPEVATTLVADLVWAYSGGPNCAIQLEWSFRDYTPGPIITSGPTVEHAFGPTSAFGGPYDVSVRVVGGQPSAELSLLALWGELSVTAVNPSAREGSTSGRVAITRTDVSTAVDVHYETKSSPDGYIEEKRGFITLEAGQSRKEIEIPIINDNVFLSELAVGGLLLEHTAGWRFDRQVASFRIEDDDEPTLYKFHSRGATVSEGTGGVTLQIDRSGATAAADIAVVELGRSFDDSGVRRFEVPFAAGATQGSVHIPITNDSLWEETRETNAICYSNRSPDVRDQIEIKVLEDDPQPQLSESVIEVTESDATRFVPMPLEWQPGLGHPYWFTTISTDGTATQGDDYAAISTYADVNAFGVTIVGDDVAESDEFFTVNFAGPIHDSVTIRIIDDDRPPSDFAFESSSYQFGEAGGTIGIVRAGTTSSPATVTLRVLGRTPSVWSIPDLELAFAAGETLKRVPIAMNDDWFTNVREATLELEWNGFRGASADLALLDDEPMPMLSLSDADVLEGKAGVTKQAEFTFSLSAPVGADILLTVATEHGTATAADYTPLVAKQVHIPVGVTSVKVPVTILGDDVNEGSESFTLKITSCCSNFAQLANATATATIREEGTLPDTAAFKLDAASTVNEEAEWLTATVTRLGDTSGRSVATVKLTADAARRFTPVTLHFAPGQAKKDVRFAIDDGYRSGDAIALLEVFADTRRADKREVTIHDNELSSALTIHDVIAYEPASVETGMVTFVVTIDPPSFQPIDVDLTTSGATARPDADFVPVTGLRRIPSLATRYELPVTINGDWLLEAKETFVMALRTWSQPGVAASVADGLATCSIVDHAHAVAKIGAYDPRVARGATSAVTVDFPAGAINVGPLVVTSSDPGVLSVPATVPMTIGATSVTIPVTGVRRGDAKITITLPVYDQRQILEAALSVYDLHAPVVTPAAIAVEAGSSVRVQLLAAPLSEEDIRATLAIADGSIAMVENAVTIPRGGYAAFDLAGATPGQTELLVTFESAAGGTTLRVPVIVTSGEGKRRGARH